MLIKRIFLLMGRGGYVGVGWGGGVNVLSSAYSTYYYAPEISGMLATLHVATQIDRYIYIYICICISTA